ncbi:MAG: hypothetical protein LAT84_00470 [Balneolia bacterium]|nr:hypothetical protein [Balneolia bacterium]
MSINILLAAEESAGLQTLKLLYNRRFDFNLKGVLTGSGDENSTSPVYTLASKIGCEVFPAENVKKPEFANWMIKNKIDILLNVHSLYLIHSEVIDAAKMGAFNLHPGRLPEYAGLNTPSWSIFNEEPHHGVSLHRITEGVDTGNVIYESRIPAEPTDTGLSVSLKCAKEGIDLIGMLLTDLIDNQVPDGRVQELSQRSYFKRHEIPGDGQMDWKNKASRCDAFIRASNYAPFASPWGTPYSFINHDRFFFWKSIISDIRSISEPGTIRVEGDLLFVSTGDFDLQITDIRNVNKKLSNEEVQQLNGHRFSQEGQS